jgi:ribonuclease HI
MNARPEKYLSIFSDSQVVLKVIQAATTTSPLVWQCQKVLNGTSTHHSVRIFWVPGRSGILGNYIADRLMREETVHQFVRPEPINYSILV